jgi:hypothetical protein
MAQLIERGLLIEERRIAEGIFTKTDPVNPAKASAFTIRPMPLVTGSVMGLGEPLVGRRTGACRALGGQGGRYDKQPGDEHAENHQCTSSHVITLATFVSGGRLASVALSQSCASLRGP